MSNRTVLITGTNRGLGLEFVKQYAKEGWRIIACYSHSLQATELQETAQQYSNIVIERLDVT